MDGRVLFVGGIPWEADAADAGAALRHLCPQCTHVSLRDPHRGWALLAFRSPAAAEAAAAAVRGAAGTGGALGGAALEVAAARRVPASWPAEVTMSDEELAESARQQERAERHHAHLKRRRQRQREETIGQLESLLAGLERARALPRGASVWEEYTPLAAGLAAEWAASGGGAGDAAADAAATDALLSRAPPRLARALRRDRLEAALSEALRAPASGAAGAAPPGPIRLDPTPAAEAVEAQLLIDWGQVPAAADPALGGRLADADGGGRMNLRALRKRVQVEGFALALLQLLPRMAEMRRRANSGGGGGGNRAGSGSGSDSGGTVGASGSGGSTVVDFGSGGGNLVLPLAWLFGGARLRWVAVDLKPAAVGLVARRASEAGLADCVDAVRGAIEDYAGPAHAVLALHACGAATDRALQQAVARRAAFVVSPCCIGKVNLAAEGGGGGDGGDAGSGEGSGAGGARLPPLSRPRSQLLQRALAALAAEDGCSSGGGGGANADSGGIGGGGGLFAALASVADFSHTEGHGAPELAAAAKAHVELDRALAAGDDGYAWRLTRLPQPELTAKSCCLLGWPAEAGGGRPGSGSSGGGR